MNLVTLFAHILKSTQNSMTKILASLPEFFLVNMDMDRLCCHILCYIDSFVHTQTRITSFARKLLSSVHMGHSIWHDMGTASYDYNKQAQIFVL